MSQFDLQFFRLINTHIIVFEIFIDIRHFIQTVLLLSPIIFVFPGQSFIWLISNHHTIWFLLYIFIICNSRIKLMIKNISFLSNSLSLSNLIKSYAVLMIKKIIIQAKLDIWYVDSILKTRCLLSTKCILNNVNISYNYTIMCCINNDAYICLPFHCILS